MPRYMNPPNHVPAKRGDDRPDDPSGRTGILLINLGTPEEPTPRAVRRFLAEMLSDPRIVELPRLLWLPILHGIVLPARSPRSARAYRKIWTAEGSPQLVIARRMSTALAASLERSMPGSTRVEVGMTYGSPSIASALIRLGEAGARRVLVLPLFPQYASASTGAAFDRVTLELRRWRRVPALRFVEDYHDAAAYIEALRASIVEYWQHNGRAEHLLMSFHSTPRRSQDAGDPYFHRAQATGRLLARSLGLRDEDWTLTFQSRFGYQEWLRPYTDETLRRFAQQGVKRLNVVCPGFSMDCLESLEEIAMTGREQFRAAGGERLDYIPALNDRADHIEFLAGLIAQQCSGWTVTGGERDTAAPPAVPSFHRAGGSSGR